MCLMHQTSIPGINPGLMHQVLGIYPRSEVSDLVPGVAEFRSLCESTPDNLIEDWTKLEKKAQKARRAVHDAPSSEDKNALLARLQIYDVTPRNCTSSILFVPYQWILTA